MYEVNLREDLAKVLKASPIYHAKTFEFCGQTFPTKITKRFFESFKGKELFVVVEDESIKFKWANGYAHINSMDKQARLAK